MGFFLKLVTGNDPFERCKAYALKFGEKSMGNYYSLTFHSPEGKRVNVTVRDNSTELQIGDPKGHFFSISKRKQPAGGKGHFYGITAPDLDDSPDLDAELGFERFPGSDLIQPFKVKIVSKEEAESLIEPWAKLLEKQYLHKDEGAIIRGEKGEKQKTYSEEKPKNRFMVDLINRNDAEAQKKLGLGYYSSGLFIEAIEAFKQAIRINPEDAEAYKMLGKAYYRLPYPPNIGEAIKAYKEAIRIHPEDVEAYKMLAETGYDEGDEEAAEPDVGFSVTRFTWRFEEAVSALKKALQDEPDNFTGHAYLAAYYSLMGREKEARAEAAEVLRIRPKFSLDTFAKVLTFKNQAQKDLFIDALRKAGLK